MASALAVYRGLMQWRPTVLASGLVFALAGLMFAAAASSSQGTDLRAERALELRDLVRQESDRVERLEESVSARQRTIDGLIAGRDPEAVALRDQVEALRSAAGLTPVVGRALQVTLDDAPLRESDDPLWQTLTPNDVIVHQADVEAVINALWRGGAEAISVMDQRLVATSSVQCVGNTLLLNGRVYSPPYVVTAIGPMKPMRESLWQDPAVADYRAWAQAVGLGYEITRIDHATIPAFEGPIVPEQTMDDAGTSAPSDPTGASEAPSALDVPPAS